MRRPLMVTDIEFLQLSELNERHHLYLYRENSALLRSAVQAKVTLDAIQEGRELKDVATYFESVELPHLLAATAEREATQQSQPLEGQSNLARGESAVRGGDGDKKVLLPSLFLTVTEVSLFGNTLTVRDLGDLDLKRLPLSDIERTLFLIAGDRTEQSLCLLVPDTHKIVGTAAWLAAVETIGLIEEPLVTVDNYLTVARAYFPQSRLGNLQHLSENRRLLSRLREFVEREKCTPFALSMQIDMIVLSEMESGAFREFHESGIKRRDRWALPETLRRFLDNRDEPSFSALMLLIDRLRHDRMLEPHEILARLYRATTGTLESRDKRYRRLEDPAHIIWGALLLANELNFLKGNAFVAMDDVCQKYSRATKLTAWLSAADSWQTLAPILDLGLIESPSRLDSARRDLQRALRGRVMALEDEGLGWFHELGCAIRSWEGMERVERAAPTKLEGVV
jgi:hypothetical protein